MKWHSFLSRCGVSVAALAAVVAVSPAYGQSSSSADFSSAAEFHTQYGNQYPSGGGGYGNGGYHRSGMASADTWHKLAIEAGAGFDAPLGNTARTQTFGLNIRAGGGLNFSKHAGLLLEYEFNRSGIPNSVLAAQSAPQGNVHMWGFTLDPIVNYKTGGSWGGYVTGGGGFYRKLTTFTEPVYEGTVCDFYGYCYPQYGNVVLSHFSSNQGGVNLGTGLTHRLGESGAKVFAEARYEWVNSPRATPSQLGSGTVSMIPVTFGIRW